MAVEIYVWEFVRNFGNEGPSSVDIKIITVESRHIEVWLISPVVRY